MSLPSEYDCWRCACCPDGKECTPIYHGCERCNDADLDCKDCHGEGGMHVCQHDTDNKEQSNKQSE